MATTKQQPADQSTAAPRPLDAETADLFERIDAYYRQSIEGDELDEREHPRRPFDHLVVISPCDRKGREQDERVCCQGKDVSLWGLSCVSPTELTDGARVRTTFVFEIEGRRRFVEMLGRIRHVAPCEARHWLIGLQFEQTLPDADE